MIHQDQNLTITADQPVQIPQAQSKSSNLFLLILLVIVAVVAGFIGYQLGSKSTNSPIIVPPEQGVACTMEAKICPDGSAVGRIPPTCEFEACPSGTTSLYETERYSFEYPNNWTVTTTDSNSNVATFSNNNEPSSSLTVTEFVYQDFVSQLYKQPESGLLKDQVSEFVAYESVSTANLGDMCPEVGVWSTTNAPEYEGYIVPITLNCPNENYSPNVQWSFIKNGDTLIWLNENKGDEASVSETIINNIVFK